jgi:hypothetical protein
MMRLHARESSSSFQGNDHRTGSSIPSSKKAKEEYATFDGVGRKWDATNKIFLAQLETTIGENSTPLTYVLREKDEYNANELDEMNEVGRNIATTPLQGRAYKLDNWKVYHNNW